LVIPNLIVGAAIGRMFGLLYNVIQDSRGRPHADPGFFALLGLAALWSSTSRLTLTVVIVCLELTGDFQAIPALITVSFTTAWLSSFCGESLYHKEMANNGAPFLPHEAAHILYTATIGKVMSHRHLHVLTELPTSEECHDALNSGHNGFPVCERLIVDDARGRTVRRYRPVGVLDAHVLRDSLSTLALPPGQRLSTTSIMNVSPTIVREDATAAKVFHLMRTLGLRHILVVDADGFLVGIVTRKDMLRGTHRLEAEAKRHHANPLDVIRNKLHMTLLPKLETGQDGKARLRDDALDYRRPSRDLAAEELAYGGSGSEGVRARAVHARRDQESEETQASPTTPTIRFADAS
ncbi:hypothetical protein BDK51DRAFT_27291, partial [Blyttiomyces helicus]